MSCTQYGIRESERIPTSVLHTLLYAISCTTQSGVRGGDALTGLTEYIHREPSKAFDKQIVAIPGIA